MDKVQQMQVLCAKIGVFFANCDGVYETREQEFIENQSVSCDAKNCVSNENGYCIKNAIEVRKKDFGAKCMSFIERQLISGN